MKKPFAFVIRMSAYACAVLLTLSACKPAGPDERPSGTATPSGSTTSAGPTSESLPPDPSLPVEKPSPTNPSTRPGTGIVTGKPGAGGTYTGYAPLPEISFKANDPENSRGLPTKRIAHSYGVAKDGVAHRISVENQKFFEEKRCNAVTLDTKSPGKVLYLTFDCGWENGYTAKVLDTLREKNVPAAFFATLHHIKTEPELTARMILEGHIVGNHSDKHPDFTAISRERMAQELQACDNYLRLNFGYTAPYFRFPEGSYSENALELVQSLGYKSVFWSCSYPDWDVNNTKGKQYAFDTVTQRLHPGAVILLHAVSPDNAAALGDIIDWARAQGYEFRALTQLPN